MLTVLFGTYQTICIQILEKASETLQDKLRLDESALDIADQFSFRPDMHGSHRYYTEPYKTQWGPLVSV